MNAKKEEEEDEGEDDDGDDGDDDDEGVCAWILTDAHNKIIDSDVKALVRTYPCYKTWRLRRRQDSA